MKIESKVIRFFDLIVRLYLAFFLVEYGVAKFTGNMFNNATPKILNTPLKEVDMFHLTWFWFQKNILLSYLVGFFQLLSAFFFTINRLVFAGIFIAFPVFINILAIDIYCVGMIGLSARVFLYVMFLFFLCWHRRTKLILAIRILSRKDDILRNDFSLFTKILIIPFAFAILFLFEALFTYIIQLLITGI